MNTCCMYIILAANIKHNKNGSQIKSYIFNSSVATSVRRRTGDQKQLSNFKWFEKYLKLIRIASDKDQMVQHSTQLNKKTDLGWGRNGDVGVLFLKIHSPGMTYVDHVFSFAENCIHAACIVLTIPTQSTNNTCHYFHLWHV